MGDDTEKRPHPDENVHDEEGLKKRTKLEETESDAAKRSKKKWSYSDIPNSKSYHLSLMHADSVTQTVHNAKHGYVITGSMDGVVKFWKRLTVSEENMFPKAIGQSTTKHSPAQEQQQPCLEFVKSFTAHTGPVNCLAMEDDWCASVSDNEIQIYDVRLFDSLSMIPTKGESLTYTHAVWIPQKGTKVLAVAVKQSGSIYLYSTLEDAWMKQVVTIHGKNPVTAMVCDTVHNCVISADKAGIIEIWDSQGSAEVPTETQTRDAADDTFDPSDSPAVTLELQVGGPLSAKKHGIQYKSKLDTDLYKLVRKKTFATSLAICGSSHFAVYGRDDRVRIFDFAKAKIAVTYDERLTLYDKIYSNKPFSLDAMEYGTRAAKEKQMQQENDSRDTAISRSSNVIQFDPSGKYLILSTLMGLKVIEWRRNKLVCIIGQNDASAQLRFTNFCLCPGSPVVDTQMELARRQARLAQQTQSSTSSSKKANDEEDDNEMIKNHVLLVALANDQRRLYVFSQYNVVDDPKAPEDIITRRDIWNEAPSANDYMGGAGVESATGSLQHYLKTATTIKAILRTSLGDIHLQLFHTKTPKTVENFVGHARANYYDGVIFHRVLKGFMIQTGDPLGDGTGGESIWGGEFEDEFVPGLRHDRPFTLSMVRSSCARVVENLCMISFLVFASHTFSFLPATFCDSLMHCRPTPDPIPMVRSSFEIFG